MRVAYRESDLRARAFIASTFPNLTGPEQELLIALFSDVAGVGGGFVESEEDLAAAYKAGYIAPRT